jgi:hypothetical protein
LTKALIWFMINLVSGAISSYRASLPEQFQKGGTKMSQRVKMPGIWLIVVILMLASLSLAGCAEVKIVGRAPVSLDALSSSKVKTPVDEHDLAVLAIDFDPPLEYEQILVEGEQATLLVAVENLGFQTEANVKVKARLSAYEDDTPILEKTCYIDTIAPGQIKIARFKDISHIPYRPAYRLQVWVLPVPGEIGMANNQKSYDLYINTPQ